MEKEKNIIQWLRNNTQIMIGAALAVALLLAIVIIACLLKLSFGS